jgi:hypothetical protein
LVAFNRPDTTRLVIDAIRLAAPTQMFVACDGPRPNRPEDEERVRATRVVIDKMIDWPCTIHHLYRDTNLGCGLGVSGAIDWFFAQVKEGVVLEDDCVPHPDFVPFCAELLERYRYDTRVWCVSGDNFQEGQWRGDGSYYFSRYNHCWGWASWRRAWQHYDRRMESWAAIKDSGLVTAIFENPLEAELWRGIWTQQAGPGPQDTWDYQWTFTCMINSGLTVTPNRNLVSNIGFGEGGTHTTEERPQTQRPASGILPLTHPRRVLRHAEADAFTFDHHFGGERIRRDRELASRVRTRILQLWKRCRRTVGGL